MATVSVNHQHIHKLILKYIEIISESNGWKYVGCASEGRIYDSDNFDTRKILIDAKNDILDESIAKSMHVRRGLSQVQINDNFSYIWIKLDKNKEYMLGSLSISSRQIEINAETKFLPLDANPIHSAGIFWFIQHEYDKYLRSILKDLFYSNSINKKELILKEVIHNVYAKEYTLWQYEDTLKNREGIIRALLSL